ncbi:MAG: hypothetical protein Fur0016_04980 [Anaerolineales bacterium]
MNHEYARHTQRILKILPSSAAEIAAQFCNVSTKAYLRFSLAIEARYSATDPATAALSDSM